MFEPGDMVKCVEQRGPLRETNAIAGKVYEVKCMTMRNNWVKLVGFEPLARFTPSRFVLYNPGGGLSVFLDKHGG